MELVNMKYDNIPGFPGYYISKYGKLWSRYDPISHRLTNKWVPKKFYLSRGRYRTSVVHEVKGKIKTRRYVLVALAWIPNPKNKPEVCHKDNNPSNDYYKNLYWGTHKENMRQMIRDGRWYSIFVLKNPNKGKRGWQLHSSFTKRQFMRVIRMIDKGKSTTYISKRFGTTLPTISRVKRKYREGYYDPVLL